MKPHQKKQALGSLFKSNFASGLVVFLVALPLCLVIGSLSTSHISVSGPAAGLAAIILAAITELGSFELFLCAGLIAGAIQLLLDFIRAGSLAEYIPVSVIEGMLAGIGVIIIMKQIPFAGVRFGDSLYPQYHPLVHPRRRLAAGGLQTGETRHPRCRRRARPAQRRRHRARHQHHLHPSRQHETRLLPQPRRTRRSRRNQLELAEEVSFLNKAAIKKTLKNIRPGSKVTINAERSSYIAGDVLEQIEDFANVFAKENDIDVVLKGFKSDYDHEGRDHHSHVRVGHSASI